MKVIIYTDGGCIPNPGRGGWAAVIRAEKGDVEISGMEAETTNNRMELTAAIKALETLPTGSQAQLFTDSEYVRKGITEWLPNWRKRGWKRKSGSLANQDLWMKLDLLTQKIPVEWHWVRGHSGNVLNEKVDHLVRKAINKR